MTRPLGDEETAALLASGTVAWPGPSVPRWTRALYEPSLFDAAGCGRPAERRHEVAYGRRCLQVRHIQFGAAVACLGEKAGCRTCTDAARPGHRDYVEVELLAHQEVKLL